MFKKITNDDAFAPASRIWCLLIAALIFAGISAFTANIRAQSIGPNSQQGAAGEPYSKMRAVAPIGVRIGKYIDIPVSAQGPAIDSAKGYRLQDLGKGLYLITDNAIQAMFLVYVRGVVVVDVPQSLAAYIPKAIAEVSDKPV